MVNTMSSQFRRPRPNMTPAEPSRVCCVCKKLFCCAQCRERHENTKHTNLQPDCPLCLSKKLPLKLSEVNTLLCHIVIAHLPLYCCLCGEIFKQGKDLESFGTCKWWKSWNRHLLSAERKLLDTPPSTIDGKAAADYNGKFDDLTSPPELYRNTSTPMVLGQKANLEFKTPSVPNFSLKTPKTNSASLNVGETYTTAQESTSKSSDASSNYVSLAPAIANGETPFRGLLSNRGIKEELPRSNSRKLEIMTNESTSVPSEQYVDNNCVEDMELTNIECEVLPDSQNLDVHQPEKRTDSLKKVRFSDQYEYHTEASSTNNFNVTENEEYFEACDTLSDPKQSFEQSQMKIYEDNAKNQEKENSSPNPVNVVNSQQSSGSSRVVMMVVVENNSNISTSDLIDTGLKKLEQITSSTNFSITSPSGTNSITSMDSYYSISSPKFYSPVSEPNDAVNRNSANASSSSNESSGSSGGILSAVANAVRTVMKNFSGVGSSRNVQNEPGLSRPDIVPSTSAWQSAPSTSHLASSLLLRPGKRPRDAGENQSSSHRPSDMIAPQIELRSPVAKRQRGWYKIKAREPIARMRTNRHITSPRGVSSETQVFHQGSLSVGDTVLPLPDRAHQSTQTE